MCKKFLTLVTAVALLASAVYFCPAPLLSGAQTPLPRLYARDVGGTVLIKSTFLLGVGQGSGVTVIRRTASGNQVVLVWTAGHVVDGATQVLVNGHEARVIALSKKFDIALLHLPDVNPKDYQSVLFDSRRDALPIGTSVFCIGNFLGENFPVNLGEGIVTGLNAHPKMDDYPWAMADTTSIQIAPGCSGCPVYRRDTNKAVGLIVGRLIPINFFVPVRALRELAPWAVDGNTCPSLIVLAELSLTK